MNTPTSHTPSMHRILTIPNLITASRIAGIPFLLLLLAQPTGQWAALVGLGVLAATDWVDGYVARRLDQVSELGRILDPIADHLLIHATGIALAILGTVPWWLVVAFAAGDLCFAFCFLARPAATVRLRVHWSARVRAVCVGAGYPLVVLAGLIGSIPLHGAALGVLALGLVFQLAALTAYARALVAKPSSPLGRGPGDDNDDVLDQVVPGVTVDG